MSGVIDSYAYRVHLLIMVLENSIGWRCVEVDLDFLSVILRLQTFRLIVLLFDGLFREVI